MKKTIATLAASAVLCLGMLFVADSAEAATPRKKPPVQITCPLGYKPSSITMSGATYQFCIKI